MGQLSRSGRLLFSNFLHFSNKANQPGGSWRSLINRSRQALSPLIRPQSILIQATHSPLILVSDEVQLPSFSSPSLSAPLSGLKLLHSHLHHRGPPDPITRAVFLFSLSSVRPSSSSLYNSILCKLWNPFQNPWYWYQSNEAVEGI